MVNHQYFEGVEKVFVIYLVAGGCPAAKEEKEIDASKWRSWNQNNKCNWNGLQTNSHMV